MNRLEYVINYVVRHTDLLTCDFTCVIEVLSVENVVDYFKTAWTVYEKIWFQVDEVRKEFAVAEDLDPPVDVWIL